MPTSKDVLNRLKWSEEPGQRLDDDVEVWYVHRGAPDDTRIVRGGDIVDLGRSFFEVDAPHGRGTIPYHRIFRITRGGRDLWVRDAAEHDAPRPQGEQG